MLCYLQIVKWLGLRRGPGLFIWMCVLLCCKGTGTASNQAFIDKLFKQLDSSTIANKYNIPAEGIRVLDSSFKTIKNPGRENLAKKYLVQSQYLAADPVLNYESALAFTDSALALFTAEIPSPAFAETYCHLLFKRSDIFLRQKNYASAIDNLTQAKSMLQQIVASPNLWFLYYTNMANVLYAQGKYLLAAQYFRLKYILGATCRPNPYECFLAVQENMDNVAICYANAGMNDSAMYYCNATLDYINQTKLKFPDKEPDYFIFEEAVVYSNIGNLLYQQKNYTEAGYIFSKALEGSRNHRYDSAFSTSLFLAVVKNNLAVGNITKSAIMLDSVRRYIKTDEFSILTMSFYRLNFEYYTRLKQPWLANEALQRSLQIRDSVERRDKQFTNTDVAREFENHDKQVQNALLAKDNQLKKGYLTAAIIVAILICAIILLSQENLRKKSHYAKKLELSLKDLTAKSLELEDLLVSLQQNQLDNDGIMRVVAHDLKNPISAIRTLAYTMKKKQDAASNQLYELIEKTSAGALALIKDLLNNKRSITDISKELADMGRVLENARNSSGQNPGAKNSE